MAASEEFMKKADSLHQKVLCVADGKPIPISDIELVTISAMKGDGTFENLEISGVATHYLIVPTDPNKGAESLKEPVVVALACNATSDDKTIFLQNTNRWLDLKESDALEDGDDALDRFMEDHPKSVVPKFKEKGFYAKLSKIPEGKLEAAEKYNNPPWYTNQFVPPVRKKFDKAALEELKRKREAKAQAKAKVDAATPF